MPHSINMFRNSELQYNWLKEKTFEQQNVYFGTAAIKVHVSYG